MTPAVLLFCYNHSLAEPSCSGLLEEAQTRLVQHLRRERVEVRGWFGSASPLVIPVSMDNTVKIPLRVDERERMIVFDVFRERAVEVAGEACSGFGLAADSCDLVIARLEELKKAELEKRRQIRTALRKAHPDLFVASVVEQFPPLSF